MNGRTACQVISARNRKNDLRIVHMGNWTIQCCRNFSTHPQVLCFQSIHRIADHRSSLMLWGLSLNGMNQSLFCIKWPCSRITCQDKKNKIMHRSLECTTDAFQCGDQSPISCPRMGKLSFIQPAGREEAAE
jgi:hypothetical protein